jgi:hypothetical protein
MDSVRFGRAVGVGVREVAKAAVKAAEAAQASAPTPSQGTRPAATASASRPVAARPLPQALHQGGKRFGQAAWSPIARLSGVLWHEIIGVLFGMFALVTGLEAWHGRAALSAHSVPQPTTRAHELFAIAMFLVFALFTASAFRRASRRQNRK